jgi:hypothetical protein
MSLDTQLSTEIALPQAETRPVRIDADGRIFEMSGEPLEIPGLAPEDVLEAIADVAAGRVRPLKEIVAAWNSNGL